MADKTQLIASLTDQLKQTGKQFAVAAEEVASYTVERAQHLTTLAGDPNFNEALIAERDAVALKAGIAAVDNADTTDAKIVAFIQGVLMALAHAAIAV